MTKSPISSKTQYNHLLSNITVLLASARQRVYTSINQTLVQTYWNIGKQIVEFEQQGKERAVYGSNLIVNLSKDLTSKHGKGFSERNLEQMRRFFLMFRISQTVSAESPLFPLSWSHYCELLKVKDDLACSFYEKQSIKEGWSLRELVRQINSLLFERIALSKDKEGVLELSKKGQIIEKAQDAIKNPYILEFLGLDESPNYSKKLLQEQIKNILTNE